MANSPKARPEIHRPERARLSCGCEVVFRAGVEGSPVSVVVDRKSTSCVMALHVAGMAVHDHREAIRPSTRLVPPVQNDYEES
jgi:hypothetical protein